MRYTILLLLIIPLLALAVKAQTPQVPDKPMSVDRTTVGSAVLVAPDEDYRISPGDTIDIQIEDAPELCQTFIVTSAGSIDMPFLGKIVVKGLTTAELSKSIAGSLREQDYLKSPLVRVTVKQYNSQTYFIQGSVRQPGVYQLAGRPSLVKLISLAGGLADNHGPLAVILRPRKPAEAAPATSAPDTPDEKDIGDQYDLIKVNLTTIFQYGRFDQNFRISPGDIITIPPANVFYVAGEVHAPGSFQLKDGTTLRQAIALAQGTTFKAKLDRAVIFRDNPDTGARQEIHVDISDVMSGKKEDLLLSPNDVIIVPNSRTKSFTGAFLTALGLNMARVPIRY